MQTESYVTEAGDVESWSGGKINEEEIKNVKEYIKKLREHEFLNILLDPVNYKYLYIMSILNWENFLMFYLEL